MDKAIGFSLPVMAAGLLAGCMPSPMQSTVGSIPTVQAPAQQPAFSPASPVVVQNLWKPDAPARKWRHIVLHNYLIISTCDLYSASVVKVRDQNK